MTTQNLWDAAKAGLREKIRAIQADLKKQEKHQINNLNLYLKQLEKEEQKSQSKKERNSKFQSRNKCKRNEGNSSKHQ